MKPNIVFAFADDWGRYAHAYARHEGTGSLNALIETPHFDRIADEGVLFQRLMEQPCRYEFAPYAGPPAR